MAENATSWFLVPASWLQVQRHGEKSDRHLSKLSRHAVQTYDEKILLALWIDLL